MQKPSHVRRAIAALLVAACGSSCAGAGDARDAGAGAGGPALEECAPGGLDARWFQLDAPQTDSPLGPYCGRSDQRLTTVSGEVHLSPDAFDRPEDAHGTIRFAESGSSPVTLRF
jgi:hypothetical protein